MAGSNLPVDTILARHRGLDLRQTVPNSMGHYLANFLGYGRFIKLCRLIGVSR